MLEQAIEKLRELPEREQDLAAAELLGYLTDFPVPKERAAINNGRSSGERGEGALNRQSEQANFPPDQVIAPMAADLIPAVPLYLAVR
jgi:hypothetical protein